MRNKQDHLPEWLNETVDVTLVHTDPERVLSVYLVTRTYSRGAITLTFEHDGRVLVNGNRTEMTESQQQALCALADEVATRPSAGAGMIPQVGETVRSEPEDRNW